MQSLQTGLDDTFRDPLLQCISRHRFRDQVALCQVAAQFLEQVEIRLRFAIREGSGGAGRWRGGDGVVRRLRFLQPMTASILSNRRRIAPHGLAGGNPGKTGRNLVQRKDGTELLLAFSASLKMEAGDSFIVETPGGGGYGS